MALVISASAYAGQKPVTIPATATPSYKYARYFLEYHKAPHVLKNPLDIANTGPPDFKKYMNDLDKTLRNHWHPSAEKHDYVIIMRLVINRDGSLNEYKIEQSSGKQKLDDAAVEAVQKASPFPALPNRYFKPTVTIGYKFDYKVADHATETK